MNAEMIGFWVTLGMCFFGLVIWKVSMRTKQNIQTVQTEEPNVGGPYRMPVKDPSGNDVDAALKYGSPNSFVPIYPFCNSRSAPCHSCGESQGQRGRICYGVFGECPSISHFHRKCTICEHKWLEQTKTECFPVIGVDS